MSEDTPPDDGVDERRRSLLIASATAGLFGLSSTVAGMDRTEDGGTDSDEVSSSATPDEFVDAIATNEVMQSVTSVELEGVDSQITTFSTSIQDFPVGNSPEFGAMSSGVAEDVAGDPETFISTNVDGVYEPDFSPDGFDAYDIATLSVELTVPEGAENIAFDYKFGTEENPSFLGGEFQDFFEAIAFGPDGSAEAIGLLPDGSPVTIDNANNFGNSPGGSSQSPSPPLPDPPDTTFNAVTDLQTASYNLSGLAGEEILLVLRVADASDGIYDAGVFVDNLRFTGEVDQDPGFLDVEQSLADYQEATVGAIEAEARAMARLEAGLYNTYGQEYTSGVTQFWEYLAGMGDGGDLEDDFIASTEKMLADIGQDVYGGAGTSVVDRAAKIYEFKSTLYDSMSSANDPEQAAFEHYKNFTGWEFQTVGEQVDEFQTAFDDMEADIIATLEQENPGTSQVDSFVASINAAAENLQQLATDMVDDADGLVSGLAEGGQETDIDIIGGRMQRAAPDIQNVDAQPSLAGIPFVGFSFGSTALGLQAWTGLRGWLLQTGSVLALRADLQDRAAALKVTYAMTANFVEHTAQGLLTDLVMEQVELIFGRSFSQSGAIDARIESVETPDVGADNIEEEELLACWWNLLTGMDSATFGGGWSTVEHGRQSGEVTVTNTGVEPLYPVFTVTMRGWKANPEPGQGTYERIALPVSVSPPQSISPGETETISFDYRVPLGGVLDQAEVSVEVTDAYLAEGLDAAGGTFSIDEPEGILPAEVFSGSVPEGETVSGTYTPSSDTELLVCALTYQEHYLDLHFYDSSGNHTGLDYESGQVQTQIPGSSYSGRDTGDENIEWITIDGVDPEEFTVEVTAPTITTLGADGESQSPTVSNVDATAIEIEGDAVSNEVPTLPGRLDFASSNVMQGGASGGTLSATVTVDETNGFTGVDGATFSASALEHYNDTIPAGNVSFGSNNVSVSAGGSTAVDVNVDVPGDVQPGKYEGTVTVDAGDTSDELTLRLIVDPSEVPPALEGTDLPRDLDADGRYEDVDADGSFDIFDVQAFFNNFDRPVVQNNVEYFDFDENGEVTIFDVQELFNRLQE